MKKLRIDTLRQLADAGHLRDLDGQFARWMAKLSGDDSEALFLAAALVSHRVSEGDVCVDLAQYAGRPLFAEAPGTPVGPERRAWTKALRASPAVAADGCEEARPLVLEGSRLYLARYHHFEQTLADGLHRLAAETPEVDRGTLAAALDRLFPPASPGGGVDGQRVAAAMAALRRLCIVSGGPGTGKTHTVAAVLALLAGLAGTRPPRVKLAAPTGKAAARLTEAIRRARGKLPISETLRAVIPAEAMTLHRLLGVRPGRANPRHGPNRPLHLDLLVVDEASMIDLPLMARTVAALPAHARLILLGDRDQLASVEAGSVFSDLCAGAGRGYGPALREDLGSLAGYAAAAALDASPLGDCVALLEKSYRFGADSGIGALARAINAGDDPTPVLAEDGTDIAHADPGTGHLAALLAERAVAGYRPVLAATGPDDALRRMEGFTILCATREGPAGVAEANRTVTRALGEAGLIAPDTEIYAGRPILVTRNDYTLGLFNGDIGILWPDPAGPGLRAWFRRPDGTVQGLSPGRLPDHETAFALTVHKSQGSEFDRVLLLLPDRDVRVLTRELIYTGITRARNHVAIWGAPELIRAAAARTAERTSGLADRLWHRKKPLDKVSIDTIVS